MDQWEYSYLTISDEVRMSRDAELEVLNKAGAEGWEFSGYSSDTGFGMDFLMKRKRGTFARQKPIQKGPITQ